MAATVLCYFLGVGVYLWPSSRDTRHSKSRWTSIILNRVSSTPIGPEAIGIQANRRPTAPQRSIGDDVCTQATSAGERNTAVALRTRPYSSVGVANGNEMIKYDHRFLVAECLEAGVSLTVANRIPQSCTGADTTSPSRTGVATSEFRPASNPVVGARGHSSGCGQKRRALDQSGDGSDDERRPPRPSKKGRHEHERGRHILACPFFKKDPVRWRNCYRHGLTRIRDVKQHIRRAHRARPYCPTCGEVFEDDPTEERLNRHVRSRECEPKVFDRPQGITWQQREQLARRVPSGLSEAEQWFVVFDTVFPGQPRPSTPYVDPDMSEDLSSYLEFSAARGSSIIRRSIYRHASAFASLDDESMESLLRQGMDDLRREWYDSRYGRLNQSLARAGPVDEQSSMISTSMREEYVDENVLSFLSMSCDMTQDSDRTSVPGQRSNSLS